MSVLRAATHHDDVETHVVDDLLQKLGAPQQRFHEEHACARAGESEWYAGQSGSASDIRHGFIVLH